MSIAMRTIVFALVLIPHLASADRAWRNPYNGTTWNNPMSSLADVMLHNKMNEAMLNATLAKKDGGTAAQPAATSHQPYTKTDFTPAKQRLVVDTIIAGLAQTAEQRDGLAKGMALVFAQYEKSVRKNNVAYAVAFMIGASLQVQTGQTIDDATGEVLAQAVNDALASNPAFAKASAADRQKLYEMCITLGGLTVLFNEVGKQDPKSADAAKVLAKQSLAMLGVK
jgi:hypothetical protein